MHPQALAHLNILLNLILNRHFRHFHCVFVLGGENPSQSFVKTVIYDQAELPDLNLGCQGIIIQTENTTLTFGQVEDQMVTTAISRFHTRRYLVVSSDPKIFGLAQVNQVKDFLVIQPESKRFKLLSNGFVGVKPERAKLVDVWFPENQTFLFNAPLYPEIADFQGRTLTVSSFTYIPYDIIGDSLETSGGIEITLVSEFVKKFNLTVALKDKGKEQWGHGYENGTGYGAIGDVVTQKSDIAAADVFMIHRDVRADVSMAVLVTRVLCLVPKPKQVINLLTPFSQFTPGLWGLHVLFVWFSNLAVFLVLLKTRRVRMTQGMQLFKDTTYDIISLFLLQPIKIANRFRHVRSLLLGLFVLALIMSNLYSSGLASRMVIPSYGGEINSLMDLAESDLPWGITDKSLWTSVIDHDERDYYKRIVGNFQELNETELKSRRLSGQFGFPTEKLPSGHYAIQDYMDEAILEKVQPMKEELYWSFTVFLVRKNFVLLPVLDRFILRVQQHGLLLKWEQKALELANPRLQSMLKHTREKRTHEKLAWIHIQGVLAIWFVGVAFSIACFACEIFKKPAAQW